MIGLDTNVLARYYVISTEASSKKQSDLAIDVLEDGFDFADALHHASCRQCRHL